MKNLIFIAFFLFSLGAFGQNDAQIAKQAKPMIELYKLDNTQASQFISILKTKAESLTEVNSSKEIDKTESLQNLETAYEKSFLAILNDDQKKIFEAQKIIADGIRQKASIAPKK